MMKVKKRDIEIRLEKVPAHPAPRAHLEQYSTPAVIAADILFTAFSRSDIFQRRVTDLGCGTGIFALGAALMGASSVKGIDIDESAVAVAREMSDRWDLSHVMEFEITDVNDHRGDADTVIMNPPFGSQKKGADRPFLKKAFEIAPEVYSLHNQRTEDFLREFISRYNYRISEEKRYMFDIDNMFGFHKEKTKEFEVILFVSSREGT